jgi:hypothetical protein
MDKQTKENKELFEESMEKLIETMREIVTLLGNNSLIDDEVSDKYSELIDQYLVFVINARSVEQMETMAKFFRPWSYAIRRDLSLWLQGRIDNLAKPLAVCRNKPGLLSLLKTGFLQLGNKPHCCIEDGRSVPWVLPVGEFYTDLVMEKLVKIKTKDKNKKAQVSTILTNTFLHHLLGVFMSVADKETDRKRLLYLWKTKASKARIEIKTQSTGIMGKLSKLLKNKALGKMLEQATNGAVTAKQIGELKDKLSSGNITEILGQLTPYLTQAMANPDFAQMMGGQMPDLTSLMSMGGKS